MCKATFGPSINEILFISRFDLRIQCTKVFQALSLQTMQFVFVVSFRFSTVLSRITLFEKGICAVFGTPGSPGQQSESLDKVCDALRLAEI